MGRPFGKARPAVAVAASVAAVACVAPPVRYFSSPPPDHTVFMDFTDTVLIYRQSPTDSVSQEGVEFAFALLDQAEVAGEGAVAGVVRMVLDAVPEPDRQRGDEAGVHDADIFFRVQRQGLTNMANIVRADVLIVTTVAADTVEFELPHVIGRRRMSERWLVLVLGGQGALDPAVGLRN